MERIKGVYGFVETVKKIQNGSCQWSITQETEVSGSTRIFFLQFQSKLKTRTQEPQNVEPLSN
eukprot:snap_masked-scaffold_4-processed-gene-21.56-mRNA-1 protein AED:1.00 eAED:1.00 QI:0/-1/0/0/-1/1/1/0/62